eukprot:scaffold3270_cov103-Cylindrotheca_fusiformis.AAC.3
MSVQTERTLSQSLALSSSFQFHEIRSVRKSTSLDDALYPRITRYTQAITATPQQCDQTALELISDWQSITWN